MSVQRRSTKQSGNRKLGRKLLFEGLEQRTLMTVNLSGGFPTWIEQGPGPTLNGQTEGLPNNPVTGSVQGLEVHPTDANILFVGGSNGGVWRTLNATAGAPNWEPLTDQFPSLSVGGMSMNPAAPNQMLVAIGNRASGGFDAQGAAGGDRIGALYSADALAPVPTWRVLSDTISNSRNIAAAVRNTYMLIAGTGGLYRSFDGGDSFTLLSGSGGLPGGALFDLVGDPSNGNRFYAAGANGVFRCDDLSTVVFACATVTDPQMNIGGSTNNARLAVHNSPGNNVVYVGVINNGQLAAVTWSTNQGGNWTAMDVPGVIIGGSTVGIQPREKPGSQGGVHFSMAADPTNANLIYVGGDRQQGAGPNNSTFPNPLGAGTFSGNLFRGNRSVAQGAGVAPLSSAQWTPLTHNYAAGNGAPHADSRRMAFDANGDMIETDDGGVYRRTSPSNAAGSWQSVNGDLAVAEFWTVSFDTVNGIVFGGTQDTGTIEQSASNNATWDSISLGDGFFSAVDNTSIANSSVRYTMGNTFTSFRRRVFDNTNSQVGGTTVVQLAAPATPATPQSGLNATDAAAGANLNVFVLNATDPRLMMVGATGLYEDNNAAGNAGDVISTVTPATMTGFVRSIAYGGRRAGVSYPQVAFVGTQSGELFVRGEAGGFTASTTGGSGQVTDVVVDPDNWQTAYVLQGNSIYRTPDGGTNYTDITSNLGNLTTELRALSLWDPTPGTEAGDEIILAGGRGGVYRLLPSGTWSEYGPNMPNTIVQDLQVYGNALLAGTYGRGAWLINDVSTTIDVPGILTIVGDTDFVNQNDVIKIIRDANNPSLVNVFLNNPGPVPTAQVSLASLEQINVFSLGGNDQLIVDSSFGLIELPNGIFYDGGSGFDRLDLNQASGTQASETIHVGQAPGDGQDIIVGVDGEQKVQFENLEPIATNVIVPAFNVSSLPGLSSLLQDANEINYQSSPSFGPTWGRFTIDNFELIDFTNKAVVLLSSGAGSDSINLNNSQLPTGMTNLFIDGEDPTFGMDRVTVAATAGVNNIIVSQLTGSGARIENAQAVPVEVSNIEGLEIDGSGNADSLTYESPAGLDVIKLEPGTAPDRGTIYGVSQAGGGQELLVVTYRNLSLSGEVRFDDAAGTRADMLVIDGSNANDAFAVDQPGNVTNSAHMIPVRTPGIDNLGLLGGNGLDAFTVNSQHPFAQLVVDGGAPEISPDTLLIQNGAGIGLTVDLTLNSVTAVGFGEVLFRDIESITLGANNSNVSVNLTAGEDSLTYSPQTANSGKLQLSATNTVITTLATTLLTINGQVDSADEVVFTGTNSRDLITVDETTRNVRLTDVAGVARLPVVLGNTLETLSVKALDGNDTILVIPAPTVGPIITGNLLVNIDGGELQASDALVIAAAGGASLPATDFVVQAVASSSAGRVRVYRNAVAMPDISYSNVERVTPIVATLAGAPNLLVMGPDISEPNEFRTTAMVIDGGQSVTIDNLAIFPDATEHAFVPADVDWFQITAGSTGILDVTTFFETYSTTLLPGGGGLGIRLTDAAGNVIAGAGTFGNPDASPNARVRMPVVAGQTYFVLVYGANADGTVNSTTVNAYELAARIVPVPIPTDIELLDNPVTQDPPLASNSDTGRSQLDNITRDNTPTLVFRVDDAIFLQDLPGNSAADSPPDEVIAIPFQAAAGTAGYRIAIFDEGSSPAPGTQVGTPPQQPLGFATFVSAGVYQFTTPVLSDGTHFLTARVQMVDPATPQQTGWGARSLALEVIVDTVVPPAFFGNSASATDGLLQSSDSGIATVVASYADRITNDVTPTMYGSAEANSIMRLYVDRTNDGFTADDILLGQTVARALDGTNQSLGEWDITPTTGLNSPDLVAAIGKDGVRHLFVTAEDVAGNVSLPQALDIMIDTTSPIISSVTYANGDSIFQTKPLLRPTPVVTSLFVTFTGGPLSAGGFNLVAVDAGLATDTGNYQLVGDHNGNILITNAAVVSQGDTTVIVRLDFSAPLPDDRFTLTLDDSISDAAQNFLDGDSQSQSPGTVIDVLPSGNGIAGGDFVARFTVDSRPEIGAVSEGLVYVDINGNMLWDPTGKDDDKTNRDFVFQFGQLVDAHFAGNFAPTGAAAASGFDKLGAYGRFAGTYSFILDTNDDGVGDFTSVMPAAYQVNGNPVAGNFNAAHPGDEIGLFDGRFWYLDVSGNNQIDVGERFAANFNGIPVVGDFNGDGSDDLAAFNNATNQFIFDTNRDGNADFTWNVADDVNRFVGLSGFTDRPVAGDLNLDGIDDIGLWVKDRQGTLPRDAAEYFFWLSDRVAANPADVFDAYSPDPLGNDLFAQFGDELALPIFGNFDPPLDNSAVEDNVLQRQPNPLDINGDGFVTALDALLAINVLNTYPNIPANSPVRAYYTIGEVKADTNGDRTVSAIDALLVINELNRKVGSAEGEGTTSAAQYASAADSFFEDLGADAGKKRRGK